MEGDPAHCYFLSLHSCTLQRQLWTLAIVRRRAQTCSGPGELLWGAPWACTVPLSHLQPFTAGRGPAVEIALLHPEWLVLRTQLGPVSLGLDEEERRKHGAKG